MSSHLALSAVVAGLVFGHALPAYATCRVSNETGHAFTIESGNVSNQRLGGHTTASIASGKIVGKSDDGKAIAGVCKDGDELVIKDEKGTPLLVSKK